MSSISIACGLKCYLYQEFDWASWYKCLENHYELQDFYIAY